MAVTSIVKLSELELQNRIDSEFYSPEYMNIMNNLKKFEYLRIGRCCFVTSGSTPPERDPDLKSGIILLKTVNIREGYIDIYSEEPFFIDEILDEQLKSSRLQPNDVLINIVGATHDVIGRVALVPNDFPRANITQAMSLIRVRTPDFLPEYIFAFLYSKYGRKQVCRIARPTAQYNLNHEETKSIIIPKVPKDIQKRIRDIYRDFYDFYKKSIDFYTQAENLLLEELGLKDFKPKYKLFYTANLSQVFRVHRVDAEYFQPAYRQLVEYLKNNFETKPLNTFLLDFQKGIEVGSENYQEEGKPFIRVSNLSVRGLVERDQKYISEELYQQFKYVYEPKVGEFLLTKDATPGIAYVIKEPVEGIIASGILRLTVNENGINREYLALCINSIIGKLQIERDGGGSVITHWRPEQIKRLQIPVLSDKIQQGISNLIQQSHEARKKAKGLLEEAKRKVEDAIENTNKK